MLFSFFCICTLYQSQILKRSSDNKEFSLLNITNKGISKEINRGNLKKFPFKKGDSIFFNQKKYEFTVSNDTLTFYDKTSKIDDVLLRKKKKKKKKMTGASFFNNYTTATLMQPPNNSKRNIKSIILFPRIMQNIESISGKVHIKLLKVKNDLPDLEKEILSFDIDLKTIKRKSEGYERKWEINLPQPITLPADNFYMTMTFDVINYNSLNYSLNTTEENLPMYLYDEKRKVWEKQEFGQYEYELELSKK